MVKLDATKVYVTSQAFISDLNTGETRPLPVLDAAQLPLGGTLITIDLPKSLSASIAMPIEDSFWLPVMQPPQYRMLMLHKGLIARWVMQNRVRRPRSIKAVRIVGWSGNVQIKPMEA